MSCSLWDLFQTQQGLKLQQQRKLTKQSSIAPVPFFPAESKQGS